MTADRELTGLLELIAAAAVDVRQLEEELEDARAHRNALMRRASDAGLSHTAIAGRAGMHVSRAGRVIAFGPFPGADEAATS